MAQIIFGNQAPVYCNLQAIQSGGSQADTVLTDGEVWTVDSSNGEKTTDGRGRYDKYIVGDGTTTAQNLEVLPIDSEGGTDYVVDYSKHYLTIESFEDNNVISWKASNTNLLKAILWSTDLVNWTSVTSSTSGTTITTLNTSDKIYLKGSNIAYGNNSYYNYFITTGSFNVSGNIMSLIYGDNFQNQMELTATHTFKYLFYGCSKLVSCANLILPATTLANYCYFGMFLSCASLTTGPELPATTLANNCYYYMFQSCTSLTTTPELPATTLAKDCYNGMFQDCISITTTSELPATTLVYGCYQSMFQDCISLTVAPELPATTLAAYCYEYMFYNCILLNYIKMLAVDVSATDCLKDWVYGVSPTGTFVKNDEATWELTGTYEGNGGSND